MTRRTARHEHLRQCRGDDQQLPPGQSARLAGNQPCRERTAGDLLLQLGRQQEQTAETIGAQGSGFGFSVPAGGYDQEDRLTAWTGRRGPQPELDPLGRRRLDRAQRRRP